MKFNIKKLIKKTKEIIARKKQETYKIGKVNLTLSKGHLLPHYQKRHKNYDRFLPFLVRSIRSGVVVDVGANVGDTLAAMVDQNASLSYLAIEADEEFFLLLKENLKKIKEIYGSVDIKICKELVGDNTQGVFLDGKNGTKKAVKGGTINSKNLDEIIDEQFPDEKVALIKTDVDGFDYDVLNSVEKYLNENPLIYSEFDIFDRRNLDSYKEAAKRLKNRGYVYYSIFDNFGQYMITTDKLESVFEILDYIYRQKNSTRTVYYVDILMYRESEKYSMDYLIGDYINKYE